MRLKKPIESWCTGGILTHFGRNLIRPRLILKFLRLTPHIPTSPLLKSGLIAIRRPIPQETPLNTKHRLPQNEALTPTITATHPHSELLISTAISDHTLIKSNHIPNPHKPGRTENQAEQLKRMLIWNFRGLTNCSGEL